MSGTVSVILLGDSTIDNASYVRGAPDVCLQIKEVIEEAPIPGVDWSSSARVVKRLAVDGATTGTIDRQIVAAPEAATHVVLSVGGNDALGQRRWADGTSVGNVSEALKHLYTMQLEFASAYNAVVDSIRKKFPRQPLLLIIPYEPYFGGEAAASEDSAISRAGLSLYADVITKCAAKHNCSLLDLRLLFTDGADYANPIEPSPAGGMKIAAKVVEWVARNPNASAAAGTAGSATITINRGGAAGSASSGTSGSGSASEAV